MHPFLVPQRLPLPHLQHQNRGRERQSEARIVADRGALDLVQGPAAGTEIETEQDAPGHATERAIDQDDLAMTIDEAEGVLLVDLIVVDRDHQEDHHAAHDVVRDLLMPQQRPMKLSHPLYRAFPRSPWFPLS